MKKIKLLSAALLIMNVVFSQNTAWNTTSVDNVGIGTTSPEAKLEVRKNHNDVTRIMVRNTYAAGNPSARYDMSTYTPNSYVVSALHENGGNPYYIFGAGSGVKAAYFDAPNFSWRSNTTGATYMTIANSGNLGIGTSSPKARLHSVSGGTGAMGTPYESAVFETSGDNKAGVYTSAGSFSAGGAALALGFNNTTMTNGNYPGFEMQHTGGSASASNVLRFNFIERNSSGVVIGGADNILNITGNGNVGIGTNDTKGHRLAVNGDAIFTRIKVKLYSAWPDYVFSASYRLPSLAEVEAFIKLHKHLPEVPSADEVEKEGLDVGANQAVLLKKIEELTLYVIEQNKKLNEQQKVIERQARLLAEQQQSLLELKEKLESEKSN